MAEDSDASDTSSDPEMAKGKVIDQIQTRWRCDEHPSSMGCIIMLGGQHYQLTHHDTDKWARALVIHNIDILFTYLPYYK